jgi:hypothetical protein
MSDKKSSGRDPNKSQIKGSHARTKRKLNLSTSLLHSREMRQFFGAFPGQKIKKQKPVWLKVDKEKISQPQGLFHVLNFTAPVDK